MNSDYYGGIAGELADEGDADDWEPCDHSCDEDCYDYQGFWQCHHQHCFACGGCGCPGYCDDYQTYNLRPSETGGTDDSADLCPDRAACANGPLPHERHQSCAEDKESGW